MNLIDSHAHLNFSLFNENYKDIIADCSSKGIGVLNVGTQYDTSKRAVAIANEFLNENIFASIGIHPIHLLHTEVDEEESLFTSREEAFDEQKYQTLINDKVVAVGEIGLDYFHIPQNKSLEEVKAIQKAGLIQQLNFAQKNNLPVILHARGSKETPKGVYIDLLEIIKNYSDLKGVLHCFGSDLEIAREFVDLGFYIGFTGIITFKNV